MSGLLGKGQLTSGAGSLGPSPGTTSSLCSDPPTCVALGQNSFGSVPRAIHHRLLSRRPTLSQEVQTPWKGGGRVSRTGCSSASCPLVSGMPSRQAVLRRKVAQLAGQVCLSSNRTQEEVQGVLTPSCWPGRRTSGGGRLACTLSPGGADPEVDPESMRTAHSHRAVS